MEGERAGRGRGWVTVEVVFALRHRVPKSVLFIGRLETGTGVADIIATQLRLDTFYKREGLACTTKTD